MSPRKRLKYPAAVILHLTDVCNLRCKMCYFWGETGAYSRARAKGKPKILDFELAKEIIRELGSSRPKPWYSLFGGEPLTYPYLEKLICVIKDMGSVVDTPTNGTLLSKYAPMLVRTGFDQVRVSIDGPREINDMQRGEGSYDKVMKGIKDLHLEKQNADSQTPRICILFTITPENHLSIEDFFLKNEDLDLSMINHVELQVQNFVTKTMGKEYSKFLKSELGTKNDIYWKGMLRSTKDFENMDTIELARQGNKVCNHLKELGKTYFLQPPTYSPENLAAYLKADWKNMTDQYEDCRQPWLTTEINASGEVVACHIFHELVMGNLHENSFEEIWYGEPYQKFREYLEQYKFIPICNIGCCMLYIGGNKKAIPLISELS